MAILAPRISPKLRVELERAKSMHSLVMGTFPNTFTPANNRVNMLAAKTHLSDDLFGSILYLFSAGGAYDGGAFALIRPLVEVSVEAQWLFFCANDETFHKAYAGDDVDPGLPNMMDQLDQKIGESLFAGLRANIKTLHGFTHGGIEQLARRFDTEGNLRGSYTDDEKIDALRVSAAAYVLLCSIFCQAISGASGIAERSAAIQAKYAEIYGATN